MAGLVAAYFGGSNLQVSGPTGAMTVVLIPIVAAARRRGGAPRRSARRSAPRGDGLRRPRPLRALHPLPVIEGFTLGIAVVIGLQQLPSALGVEGEGERILPSSWSAVTAWAGDPQWWSLGLTAAVVVLMLALARLRPGVPASLVAVLAATALAQGFDLDVARIGELPAGLPVPSLGGLPWGALPSLLVPALAVAGLAALESLLSATVADAMSVSERHDPDRELFGQGLANLASPLFGGIPATAAIARTAVNVRSGATSASPR